MICRFERQGLGTTSIAALYSEEDGDDLRLRLFRPIEAESSPKESEFEKVFLPEHHHFAVKMTGAYGDYHCFDAVYEELAERHASLNRTPPSFGMIEIYNKYPVRASPGHPFETLILA